jgi:uncharacterized repeat protein (TIGR01451 family)
MTILLQILSYVRGWRVRGTAAALAMVVCAGFALAETPGKDGDVTISTAVTVNQYAALAASASIGAPSVSVTALAVNLPALAPGDLILIYQAQGATISTADTAAYGAITALNNAGRWEYQTVASISTNTITLANYGGGCTGLKNSYDATGRTQVIRVPQYRNLTITGGGSISALAWDGTRGGIVAVNVSGTLSNNGAISASGAGFRGGVLDNNSVAAGSTYFGYRSTSDINGGEKGESVAGFQADYDATGRYGRGAPANGGGGGNGHNAGGGGGANGDNGVAWAGLGNPSLTTANWANAWNLDPSLTSTTTNSGGGRGGYSYGSANRDALTVAPGNTTWAGDNRQEVGGRGGRPLSFVAAQRAYFGGGGGAGDANNNAGGAGGRGGGLVMILANTMTGSGQIAANGAAGSNSVGGHNDAPGGGGGGGTIITRTGSAGSVAFQANGGSGGNQLITGTENEGPDGGGGGGVIAVSSTPISAVAGGGLNGTTSSSALTEFLPNGATRGATGQPSATAPTQAQLPFCFVPNVPPTVLKSSQMIDTAGDTRFVIPGAELFYTIQVTNPAGPIDNGSLIISDPLPAQIDFFNGDIDPGTAGIQTVLFADGTPSSGVACCGGATVAYSLFTTGTDFTYAPTAGYDTNIRRIRVTPTGSMAAALSGATSFSIKFRARVK